MTMVAQSKGAQQRAIYKAQKLEWVKQVTRWLHRPTGEIYFRVPSATSKHAGVIYRVNSAFQCNCDAGLKGKPCYHAAAVWLFELAHNRLPGPSEATKRKYAWHKPIEAMTREERKAQAKAFAALLGN